MYRLSCVVVSLVLVAAAWSKPALAQTVTVCTVVSNVETSDPFHQTGDCDQRIAPASTFKIAISLMGFDAGILTAVDAPEWPFKDGYMDFREAWRTPSTPAYWMQESVIWYSQQITQRLGAERYQAYVDAFDYGNRDVSGQPGENNGLTHAWLSSSLQISAHEQIRFVRAMLRGALPVSDSAVDLTMRILDYGDQPGGWRAYGKTGTGLERHADGSLNFDRQFGWFVGWAERGDRQVVFARLVKDTEKVKGPAGYRARDALFADLFSPAGILGE